MKHLFANGSIVPLAGSGAQGFSGDGGPATSAKMYYPEQCSLDGAGGLLVAEASGHVVRAVSAAGVISTVAGIGSSPGTTGDGGFATLAKLNSPHAVAYDPTLTGFWIVRGGRGGAARFRPPPLLTLAAPFPARPTLGTTPSASSWGA